MENEDVLINVYFGLNHPSQEYVFDDERAFHALMENIRNREHQIGSMCDQEKVLDNHCWFCTYLKIHKEIGPCERLVLEKQVLNSLTSEYYRQFLCLGNSFQLRYLDDDPAFSCADRPGILNLDNGSNLYCDVLIDGNGYIVHNWGPKAIFILPGALRRSTENKLCKVVPKSDRSIEMYRGSRNQCVDWINHRIAASVENYEVNYIK